MLLPFFENGLQSKMNALAPLTVWRSLKVSITCMKYILLLKGK